MVFLYKVALPKPGIAYHRSKWMGIILTKLTSVCDELPSQSCMCLIYHHQIKSSLSFMHVCKSIFACYTSFISFRFYTMHAWGLFTGRPLQSSWVKETLNSCCCRNSIMLWPSSHKQKLKLQQTDSTSIIHQIQQKSCWLHTSTQLLYILLPFTLLFPQVVHSFSVSVKRNAISFLLNASLSPCLTAFSSILLFSSNTFHKWQGERCPLKVIARLIKFPPPRKEQENVIKEKRRELERIDLPHRPSTPRPCPSISGEEDGKKMQENIEESRSWVTGLACDGNSSNTGVMRKRRNDREVRKAEWEDDN